MGQTSSTVLMHPELRFRAGFEVGTPSGSIPCGLVPAGRNENSPAIYRWVQGAQEKTSPVGTIEHRWNISAVPTGLCAPIPSYPSDKSLGYFQLPLRGSEVPVCEVTLSVMRRGTEEAKEGSVVSTVKSDSVGDAVESAGLANDSRKKPRTDWNDPAVPIGNAPPLPRWPVVVLGLVWLAWIGCLVAMMVSRMEGSAS